jgi:putative oxidoreductase
MKMNQIAPTYNDLNALVLRVGLGFFMFFGHGIGKLNYLFSGKEIKFDALPLLSPEIELSLAVAAELGCSILLIIGFKTRWVSLPLIFTMFVAAFIYHWDHALFYMHADGGGNKEFAIIYLIGFIACFFLGSGKYSVDQLLKKDMSHPLNLLK